MNNSSSNKNIRFTSYALIFANDQILLTLLNRGPNTGKWTLPGGGLEQNETHEQAVVREVYEETSLKLSEFKFMARFDDEFHYQKSIEGHESFRVVKNIYVKHLEQTDPVKVVLIGDSTLDVKWVSLDTFDPKAVHPTVFQSLRYFRKRFRKAGLADADVLSKLVNSAYRGESSKEGWTTEADILGGQRVDREKIIEMIETPHSSIELVTDFERPDEILGCVFLKKEAPGTLYFGMLVVRPDLQNEGIGKILMTRIENLATENGFSKVRMSVIHLRRELIEFYERRGYRKTGLSEEFPTNDPRFGIPKVDGLTLLEFEKILQ